MRQTATTVKAVFEEPPEDGEDADEDANEDEDEEGWSVRALSITSIVFPNPPALTAFANLPTA